MSGLHTLRKFAAPEVIFGNGARFLLTKYVHNFSLSHCLVVTDKGVRSTGLVDALIAPLHEAGVRTTIFDDISPNPRDGQIRRGTAVFLDSRCDGVVAIGGGSPMDAAKAIGFMATNGADVLSFEGVDKVEAPAPPMICIPTTAGTSADISQFCIVNDTSRHIKIAIVAQAAIPDVALVDPECTYSMPPGLTAATGMDALTHAFEAYVSTVSSPTTDLFALDAVQLVRKHLRQAVEHPDDVEAREGMMRASMHAGYAFSNAILGAVHAMAHSLGGILDAPHGDCNAVLLPYVVRANFITVPERYRELAAAFGMSVKDMSDAVLVEELFNELQMFGRQLGIPEGLSGLNMDKGIIPRLAHTALQDACMLTNPRKFSQGEVEALYEEAW
ncbi:iron-containing alcohol dehydrogenase [Desulfovibrio mangrovi]|uniref:iron-containing alcohol dehydrogenase n=1 Tax=Desulfovibrio mangrovi TaxID=2976983 RepID=UPI00224729A9|nr:iron-containing alcohol dehydrogenase [Desulfovibrio mangrovi]UZP67356.1 iron-containing alcohol dehydrogenase [Desulfovibrio mangrovi]